MTIVEVCNINHKTK